MKLPWLNNDPAQVVADLQRSCDASAPRGVISLLPRLPLVRSFLNVAGATADTIRNLTIPMVVESTGRGERAFDLMSRLMVDRIVLLGTPIDSTVSVIVVAQLLFLESQDANKPINMFIMSPGGEVTSGMAIFDTMKHIKAEVHTTAMGQAASMGALLLTAGEKGHRAALPHARIMIHQPLGGVQGQATDIEIHAREIQRMKKELNQILADSCGKTYDEIVQDTERDNFMTAEQAKDYGLIDKVL